MKQKIFIKREYNIFNVKIDIQKILHYKQNINIPYQNIENKALQSVIAGSAATWQSLTLLIKNIFPEFRLLLFLR